MIKKYQQKTFEACQYKYPASKDLREWMGAAFGHEEKARCMDAKGKLQILGPDGSVRYTVIEGDYILSNPRLKARGIQHS